MKKAIITDIDHTVADVSERVNMATQLHGGWDPDRHNSAWYDTYLNPEHYWMDRPILRAREFLQRLEEHYVIVYVSGRRQGTEKMTFYWLRLCGFPVDYVSDILHRPRGVKAAEWKAERIPELVKTHEELEFIAGYGDMDSDIAAYELAGIEAIKVKSDGEGWREPS